MTQLRNVEGRIINRAQYNPMGPYEREVEGLGTRKEDVRMEVESRERKRSFEDERSNHEPRKSQEDGFCHSMFIKNAFS